jgi:diaminopimelate epimerase
MHACGNDFIIIDELTDQTIPEDKRSLISRELCKRRYSIGANDILFITSSDKAHANMRIFEPDGSEADMCGNGIRCVARYLFERVNFSNLLRIKTRSGIKIVERREKLFRVNMGRTTMPSRRNYTVTDKSVEAFFVNTGEPHIIVFVDDVKSVELIKLAQSIRYNKEFARRGVNVNVVQILDDSWIKIRTYERGIEDETLSCGTGATASAVVTSKIHGLHMPITVETNGGVLIVESQGDVVYLEGPAEFVYDGVIQLNNIRLSDSNA